MWLSRKDLWQFQPVYWSAKYVARLSDVPQVDRKNRVQGVAELPEDGKGRVQRRRLWSKRGVVNLLCWC